MYTGQKRFWPKAVSIELRRLPWRVLGTAFIALAAAILLALLSWSFADPGPNYATDSNPRNWLGYRGASIAQALMEGFGLAAPVIVLPLAALGLHIATGYAPLRPRQRLLFWAAAVFTAPGFFASFPTPQRWLLGTGLGGVFGDFVAGRIAKLSPVIPPPFLWALSAMLFLLLGGWCVWRACGLKGDDLTLAFQAPAGGEHSRRPLEEAFTQPPGGSHFANRLTSWVKRLSPRNRAVVFHEGPREFWMQAGSRAGTKEEPPFEGTSPFSNWGGGFAAARPGKHRAADKGPAAEEPVRPEAANPIQSAAKSGGGGGENAYDDIRIEPFFGPKPGSPPPGAAGGAPGSGRNPPASPFLRLTGNATKAAGAGTQRIFASLARGVKSRTPLIFVKDKPAAPLQRSGDHAGPAAPVQLPPLSLLAPFANEPRRKDSADPAIMQRAGALMSVLEDFGVRGHFSGIYPGPVVTLFELEPVRGIKSSRVAGLADDIARCMGAPSVRIAAIPGRDAIGIELPNPKREAISFRAVLEAPAFQNSPAALPLTLGKSIGGEPVIADLARMPHLLIAGAGGSAGIDAMLLSLLFRLPPSQCNLIMIGTDSPELRAYDGLPHLLAPVIASPGKAVGALSWAVSEMNSRYERMSRAGVHNIASYNSNVAAAQLRGKPLRRTVQTGFHPATGEPVEEEETFDPLPMPYLVIMAGEMASLMLHAAKDVEFAVQWLSQMARAAGIHLIMAAERPSADIVTDKIKASFQSRICFQVSSKIESRAILGEQGAEQLLDAGDMLYMAPGGRIIRAHGACVQDREVEAVVRYWKAQGFPSYRGDILEDRVGSGYGQPEPMRPAGRFAAHDAA